MPIMNAPTEHLSPSPHLSPQTIAAYVADTLADDALSDVERHVARCDDCALASQEALAVGDMVDRWNAQTHGVAVRGSIILQALSLARVRSTVAALQERVAAWERRWNGQVEAALQVVVDAPGQAARVLTEGVEGLARPSAAWRFAPAPAAIPTRGAARRGAAQPIVVTASGTAGGPSARVAVSGERGEVAVRIDGVPAGQQPPLVLLVPIDRGPAPVSAEPRLALPEPGAGSDAWITRFEGLAAGEYLLAFEPLG
ncbi:MAG: hypothetical protein IT306_11230 [Chloroflexi bacterium]|nr:hypothetical protein [Chloroflexota bacterium]